MTDLLAFVRRHDPDRFLSALFAPAERRGALLALYAFNHELARAREAVREPPLALIRLQWWREVVEGAARTHEVATPLSEALAAGALARDDLLALINAREIEVEPQIDTVSDWMAYLRGTAGGLAVAAARCLGASAPESIRGLGTAYGIAGMLRAAPALARQGRCLLPADCLAAHGLSPDSVISVPDTPALAPVLHDLAREGANLLAHAPRPARAAIPAALPAVLARRDLARVPAPAAPRGLGDRLAVLWAATIGRV
jgi:15-cis-phytoene synthase